MGRRTRRIVPAALLLAALLGAEARRSAAQVTLADDIIIAAQGKEGAEEDRKKSRHRPPGAEASPVRQRPSSDILLGAPPTRRPESSPSLARRAARPDDRRGSGPEGREGASGLARGVEGLQLLPALPPIEIPGPSAAAPLDEEDGPPGGLTLDAAIDRLVRCNGELRSKFLDISQAEADVLTAGLRTNPLLFYSSDSVPYGSYSANRPGNINHGISIIVPVDYSGKRRTRIALAEQEKRVLEAQFQDAVRLAIDDLYAAYVDALAQRQAARSGERGVVLLDRLLAVARAKSPPDEGIEAAIDDLTIDRESAAMAAGEEWARYRKAKLRLATLLDLSPAEADALDLRGSLRDLGPEALPVDPLIALALGRRPDLIARRLNVCRAEAEQAQERAERFSDVYFLYTPYQYRDNAHTGPQNSTGWGAGLFASIPLYDRNQGNLKRAKINITQGRTEVASLERQVVAEVRQVVRDYENTSEDARRFDRVILPAIRRKFDRSLQKYRAGEVDVEGFLKAEHESTTLLHHHRETIARHRANVLRINTVVGHRAFP